MTPWLRQYFYALMVLFLVDLWLLAQLLQEPELPQGQVRLAGLLVLAITLVAYVCTIAGWFQLVRIARRSRTRDERERARAEQ